MSIPQGPQIHPYLTIVQRTPRTLQVGLLPQEAVMVEVPDEYQTEDVQWLLTRCDGTRNLQELIHLFGRGQHKVMSPAHVEQLLSELQQLGVAHPGNKKKPCLPRICVRGHGQLSTYARRMLSIEDVQLIEEKDVRKRECTLMVIADTIVPDPVLIRHLMENNQPFLLCSLVDNHGVVGPLVVPKELDQSAQRRLAAHLAQVPLTHGIPAHVTAQLMHDEGRASHATISATAAFAVSLIVQRTQQGQADHVLSYHQRMVVAPDAQMMTLTQTS